MEQKGKPVGEDIWELWYRRGYYDAIARMVDGYDEPSMATEMLRQYGYVILSDIDEDVADTISKLIKSEGVIVGSNGVIQNRPKY